MSTAALPIEMSLADFIARPAREDGWREELIEGELVVSPTPRPSHTMIVERLREVLRPLRERGYFITNDSSVVLAPRSMPVPDLLVVTEARWQETLATDDWLTGSPELVIEVSSRSNRRLQQKADLYLRQGAEQVWTVYPRRRTVLVSSAEGAHEAREGEQLEFHGVTLTVADLFT